MKGFEVRPVLSIRGKISLLADKSISHRAIFLSSIAKGKTGLKNFPANDDCLSTLAVFKKLGVGIRWKSKNTVEIVGNGLYGLSKARRPIFIAESGTTFRLLLGVLAGQNFTSKLLAGKSLCARPMLRVTAPLRMMGAKLSAKRSTLKGKPEEYPPITIIGRPLKPVTYKMPVASAQVKSAILLAGLFTDGKTTVIEPVSTRDHTERMLKAFKSDIKCHKNKVMVSGGKELLSPGMILLPGDISSAAFFIVAAILVPRSEILIRNVSLNPSRMGAIKILKRMGANIKVSKGQRVKGSKFEPMGDIVVKSSRLKATVVRKAEVPSLIDELPVLMVATSAAAGKSVFVGVQELHLKETDRIKSMCDNLRKMGADISISKSGSSEQIIIQGVRQLKGARVSSFGDHRTAMSMVVAGLAAKGRTKIDDISCINKSFPGFTGVLKSLTK
jgi:3-phosphoshikimate 1-carboxyvinyltransferase